MVVLWGEKIHAFLGPLPNPPAWIDCTAVTDRNPPHLPYCARCRCLVVRNPPHLPYCARCRCLVARHVMEARLPNPDYRALKEP
ncbi:hypothetical protein PGTUg99_015552 [Puccinia graminis f. sp. tritici]|uniref:Uncharacterized protein n=1 Tax=Puccinia graminis f. sp. tritici TaxID=56615 RepID=A0A5B0RK37_PUCGR|nr:hypothetical protein PGTUg99_015552 [Puccinia graminis f. sp. tritici]